MEQFNLNKWLQDKSRKICTRDGRPVRIVCWDAPTKNPIYGFVEGDDGITSWRKDGRFSNLIDNVDLFFADEEGELTEFEKELNRIVTAFSATHAYMDKNEIHHYSKGLLDLARKEIEKDIYDNGYRMGYEIGKEDALKDLPKWKKDNNNLSSLTYRLDNRGNGNVLLCRKDYAININELLNLPKGE